MLYLLLLFELILVALSYLLLNDLLSPTFDMACMFTIATAIIIPFIKDWSISYSFEAMIIIVSGLYIFFAVELLVAYINRKSIKSISNNDNYIFNIPKYYQIAIDMIIILTIYMLSKEVVRIGSKWNYYGSIPILMRNFRYRIVYGYDSINFFTSQLMKISNALGYVGVFILINDLIFKGRKCIKENKALALTPILMIALDVLNSTRGTAINYIVFIVVIYCVKYRQFNKWGKHNNSKIIKIIFRAFIAIAVVFCGAKYIIGRDTSETMLDNIARYLGGSIQLFNLYIKNPAKKNVYWGQESFVTIYQFLYKKGIVKNYISFALEERNLGRYTGNVYTLFRRPLQDFGLLGMYLFVISLAVIFCSTYYKRLKRANESHDLSLLVYAFFYHWIIQSVVDCYSFNLSFSTVITLLLLIIFYNFFKHIRFGLGKVRIK